MAETAEKNIRTLTEPELQQYIADIGEKPFRARQLWSWLWTRNARSFEEMTDLSIGLRKRLATDFRLPALEVDMQQRSEDGTIKLRFRTFDGHLVEGVLIPTEDRYTACVSSQIGCSLSCRFCATGFMERRRNLFFDEIFDEAAWLNRICEQHYGRKITNIVFMGMGEPLLNYKQVLKSIEKITAPDGLAMSPRRITVSTAGVARMIQQLGEDQVRFKLALSLHAANDAKRNRIMPINETNHIQALIEALNDYYRHTKNPVTLEYILFRGFNDQPTDADELVKIYRRVPADLVNLIEYNPIEGAEFSKPDESTVQAFMARLEKNRVNARLRRSRGRDIDAACGQLANKG